MGSYDEVTIGFFESFDYCLQDDIISFEIGAVFIFFMWLTFLTPMTPNDPRQIFKPITFAAVI